MGVNRAAVHVEVVGRAIKRVASAGIIVTKIFAGANGEIGTATAVHPDAVACDAPGTAIDAR